MVVLDMIYARLNLWLRRRYLRVIITFVILVLVTFVLDMCFLFFQRDLIFWRDLVVEILEDCFLLPAIMISISVVVKSLVVATLVADHFFPHQWLQSRLERHRRQKFANFIVRRLLFQLELAKRRLPQPRVHLDLTDVVIQQNYEQVHMVAHRAVEIFRRDAMSLLEQKSSNSSGEPRYFVLEEEEQALRRNGFARINLRVTNQVLRQLLSPLEKEPSAIQ
ncbi:uncharacterized protein LOC108135547 [Drosophila elegans]|uniref:uncharacterized protein LOC108135547 n=1 Tax=Drosophila elegans TaxID=30023 RepID=UPI0007E6379A|nr:uncharacterized protein LOC108135547 [Drosophila elegans]